MFSYRRRFIQSAIDEMSQQQQQHRCSWDCKCRYQLDTRLFEPRLNVVELGPDQSGREFIQRSHEIGIVRVMAALILRNFLSVTDTNAWCRTGDMHVFSTEQARMLLNIPEESPPSGNLLDVGAGDGGITAQLAPLFTKVVATEVSERMAERLRERGYTAVVTMNPSDVAEITGIQHFQCISCLNVLDRCDRPLDLLQSLRDLLIPDTGRLILAVVLPFNPGIERGTVWSRPEQSLPDNVHNQSFEVAANALVTDVLEPLGFKIESISRLPYMSFSVSLSQDYALLDNVLFICRRIPNTS